MATSQGIKATNRPFIVQKTQEHASVFQVGYRFLEIIAYVCVHGIRLALRLFFNTFRRQKRSRQSLIGQAIAELCDALGATFIKIGQILSTRCDLFTQDMMAPLSRLQDCIKPFPFHHVPIIIQQQLGRPLEEIFCEFEPQPISSASIGSVYRARLHTGQEVAVKIRRPGIVPKVNNDFYLLRSMASIMARFPAMRLIPMVEMIDELGQCIKQQLDLRIEAANTRHFREQLAHDSLVHIPELVDEYCTEAVMVMEFFDNLVRLDELDWTEEEYRASLLTALRALYYMIFLDGFIHCDLHPGNMYLRKGGQVVILDAGFVAQLKREDRHQFVEFFLGISMNAGKRCARILYETASYKSATFDQEQFQQEVRELIRKSSGANAANFQVATFAYQIFAIQKRFGLRGSTDFTMAILSLLVFEGIAKQLYPQLDFQTEARPFLFKAMVRKRDENAAQAGKSGL
ncbi:ABC1 kinase family protein [Dictyobacter aurantiacus]|uniref:Protein kinase domain-containing protein n=1 Tax=Dictyobacter aurantiacus TaxID=1936993 RepID=A0A401ZLE3_9CHLR|nr:AarF/UbiB family protein [Dictyobacter aurantiacus]GCE07689.1 hypothetical protein KDAU_50180 [Dictyobacter aurantiacus]